MSTFTFKLEQAAKKAGGDKYVCESDDKFCVYFPQEISRKDGKAVEQLIIKVSQDADPEAENSHVFKLEQAAKKSGGDKYICETNDKFNIYFPQTVSRVAGKVSDNLVVSI